MNKPKISSKFTLLVVVNALVYILSLLWASYFVFFVAGVQVFSLILADVVCCWGLLKHARWSWFMGIALWITEGIFSVWAAYVNTSLIIGPNSIHYTDPVNVLKFVSVGLFKFASTTYLASGKIRESYEIKMLGP
jgi:hypothetical protein